MSIGSCATLEGLWGTAHTSPEPEFLVLMGDNIARVGIADVRSILLLRRRKRCVLVVNVRHVDARLSIPWVVGEEKNAPVGRLKSARTEDLKKGFYVILILCDRSLP